MTPRIVSTVQTLDEFLRMLVEGTTATVASTNTASLTLHAGPISKDGIVLKTNVARYNSGDLPPLNPSPILDAIAKKRLEDMQDAQYFGHLSSTPYGADDMAHYFSYRYLRFGENIALGDFQNDTEVVNTWLKSQEHRANILNTHFHEIGAAVGLVSDLGRSRWMCVQVFGLAVTDCPKVDESLAEVIAAEKTHVMQLEHASATLATMMKNIPLHSAAGVASYHQKINDYALISDSIRYRIGIINTLVQEYNKQVHAFNSCI